MLSYQAAKHYRSDNDWASANAQRVAKWGFTTVGGWGDWDLLARVPESPLAHTPVLHVGSAAGAPWRDLWDPQWEEAMVKQARTGIRGPDSRTIGYYADNELGWWNGALFRETLSHPASSGQRQRLVALLRDTYANDWGRLSQDFAPDGAGSFEELASAGQVFLHPGGNGIKVYRRFLAMIAERYYQLTAHSIRSRDPNRLLLGDRYASSYYPELIRAAARELDVISTNLKASWNDGSFARFYLDSMHQLGGKPVLIGEIYFSAMENSTGNRNRNGGFPTVVTQTERAAATRRSLLELAQRPDVVGLDWFQYYDEPSGGRYDGEDFNMGLVDIHDRPYAKLVAMLSGLELSRAHQQVSPPRVDARDGVPPAPAEPIGDWAPREALRGWNRERGFVPASEGVPFADLYLCWNRDELLLAVYAMDLTEREYYRDRLVPETDRLQWRIAVGTAAPEFTIRMGAGGHELAVANGAVAGAGYQTLAYETRAVALLRVPARLLGKASLRSGDDVELDVSLDSHARAERTRWKGRFSLVEN